MLKGRQVTVLGAGVAGLAIARALALQGVEVRVLERAAELTDIGAGLQITANGVRVLRALGLGEALEAIGILSQGVDLLDGETGSRVMRLEMAKTRPANPSYFVHRADLISILAKGAQDAGAQILTGQEVVDVELGVHSPRLRMADGRELEVGLLIGADGLHSATRAALNGGAVVPFFTHQVAWRAVLPCAPGVENVARVFMGPGRHLVSYTLRGGTMRNIVAVEERRKWVEESWTLRDDPLALRLAFEDFVPEVRGWLDQVDEPWLWGLFRHPVAPIWYGLGAVILGDAAHPTLPFLAQGANMALEDAWVLAEALAGETSEAEAFAAYQFTRHARVHRIVEAANGNARRFHLEGASRSIGHAGMRLIGRLAPKRVIGRYDWLYGHDVTGGRG